MSKFVDKILFEALNYNTVDNSGIIEKAIEDTISDMSRLMSQQASCDGVDYDEDGYRAIVKTGLSRRYNAKYAEVFNKKLNVLLGYGAHLTVEPETDGVIHVHVSYDDPNNVVEQ